MNTMVVKVLKGEIIGAGNVDQILFLISLASHRALEGYIAFHRLLIYFVQEDPGLKKKIDSQISDFIHFKHERTKSRIASLGELVAMLSVSSYKWSDVSDAYMDEILIRNVKWVIQKYPGTS